MMDSKPKKNIYKCTTALLTANSFTKGISEYYQTDV